MKKLLFYCCVFISSYSGILFSSEIEQRFHSLYLSNKDQLYAESKSYTENPSHLILRRQLVLII